MILIMRGLIILLIQTAVVSNGTFLLIKTIVNLKVSWAMSYHEKRRSQTAHLFLECEDKT